MQIKILQPIQQQERIELLDVLRGFAILGIFIVNLDAFSFYWFLTDPQKAKLVLALYDHTTKFIHVMFFEGKFYSIFSMLFGIGFAIYLSKSQQDDGVLKVFKRRLAFLLVIGFMHLLLWFGDIVAFYAMLGFLLIPFRKFSNKTLLIIAALCILSPIGWYALKMSNPEVFNLAQWPLKVGVYMNSELGINNDNDVFKVSSGNDFIKMIGLNAGGIFYRYSELIFQSRGFKVFGMFLIGMVIGKTKFYHHLKENKQLLWYIIVAGLAIGLPANYLLAKFELTPGYQQLTMHGLKQTIVYAFAVAPLALAYTSILALLYLNITTRKILNVLAPVGKMALTNYIMQTLIGIFVFTDLGLGLRIMGPTAWTIFALVGFTVQIAISTIWLRLFNYGPLEWLWRSATYWKLQPMKKTRVDAVPHERTSIA